MTTKFQVSSIVLCASLVLGCTATQNTQQASTSNSANANYITQTIHPSKKPTTSVSSSPVELTMEQIMADPDWLGREPKSAFFSPSGDSILYYRKREGSVVQDVYKTNPSQGNGDLLSLTELHQYAHDEIIDDNDYRFIAWTFKGNVFIQNRASNNVKQLTKDNEKAHNLAYYTSNVGTQGVSFQKGNAFYSIDLETGLVAQLFAWKFEDKSEVVSSPEDYVAEQQQKLIQYVQVERQNRIDKDTYEQQIKQQNSSVTANTLYFDKEHTNVLASLSPNGKYAILVTRENKPSRADNDIMPDYIEENGRVKAQSVRQRVADAKSESHSIYFIDVQANTKKTLSYVALPGYNDDVLADVKRENAQAKGETYTNNRLPRDIGILFDWYATEMPIKWHDSGKFAALMLEAWDNKDRWIVTLDVSKPELTTQHRMHDKAWVNYRYNQFGWLNNDPTLFLLSEESGYSHLYVKPINGKLSAITKGRFVVDNVVLSNNDQYFYYKANQKHPGIYEIYRVKTTGGEPEMLTDLNGMTDFVLSPNQDVLLLTHSTLAMPPELYTLPIAGTETASNAPNKLTNTVSDAFLSINWTVPAIVPVKSSHTEQPIYARVYMPEQNDTSEKRRAVVFNHGAGYLQNSHLGWSGYFREFMFHSLLVSQGYVVLDMDYRASAGYGRDWRTAIYRQMGTPEVQDLKDGVNWLVENANVDRQRIGTYGGSYGGFLTFMSLFNAPDLFQAGAALRPVSDWAHYNLPYTANILNTPDVDPIAYERSSPIYFAEGLTKPLLINAPMVDDNVFFVDVVRLVQRLIELEKVNFETAIYPVEPHGFVQPSSWLDEYRRIHKLFETNL